MIWRLSLIAWILWGAALVVWLGIGGKKGMDVWTPLFAFWVLNGAVLWLASRKDR